MVYKKRTVRKSKKNTGVSRSKVKFTSWKKRPRKTYRGKR